MSGDNPFEVSLHAQPLTGQYEEEGSPQETIVPSVSKFGFTWPADSYVNHHRTGQRRLSSSGGGSESSVEEVLTSITGSPGKSRPSVMTTSPTEPPGGGLVPTSHPALSRAYSSPHPSQLGHLRNPCRHASAASSPDTSPEETQEISHLRELSLELADSVQMVIQTLLQISPPQVLDPAKEQFSACSVSFPTSSISAMFTSMKSLNYMSANMASFCTAAMKAQSIGQKMLDPPFGMASHEPSDFDIGELLQSVGDALSGIAADAGVDIILYHGDVGIKHVAVRGDESGITYALSHVSNTYYCS